MIVIYQMDRMGCLTITPVNSRIQNKIKKYLKEEWKIESDGSAFIQEDYNIEAAIEHFRPSEKRDLNHGWEIRKRLDEWTFGHYIGWDAHNIL